MTQQVDVNASREPVVSTTTSGADQTLSRASLVRELVEQTDRHLQSRGEPTTTYRHQLTPDFTFRHSADQIPYLCSLGIDTLYLSPIQEAVDGSPHGYNTRRHSSIRQEFGGREGWEHLVAVAEEHGMKILLDIVPNHMVAHPCNEKWRAILEHGPLALENKWFYIDWKFENLNGRVLAPFLGASLDQVVADGYFKVTFEPLKAAFNFRLYNRDDYPIAARTYHMVLESGLDDLAAELGALGENGSGSRPAQREKLVALGRAHDDFKTLLSICSASKALSDLYTRATRTDPLDENLRAEYLRETEQLKKRLQNLCAMAEPRELFQRYFTTCLDKVNGEPQALYALEAVQAYKLAGWKTAPSEINYRRFFDINDLVAIREENKEVFEEVHAVLVELSTNSRVVGFRVDHPDGLHNPTKYFEDLQRSIFMANARALYRETRSSLEVPWDEIADEVDQYRLTSGVGSKFPVYAEKILSEEELLPDEWMVHGETGYRMLNLLLGLRIPESNRGEFDRIHKELTGQHHDPAALLVTLKRSFAEQSMQGEFLALARDIYSKVVKGNVRYTSAMGQGAIFNAVTRFASWLPVYRTYITPDAPTSERDVKAIDWALERAKVEADFDRGMFDFLRDVLLPPPSITGKDRSARLECAMQLQKLTGPLMAKAWEDTALYRYAPFAAKNEVGSGYETFGLSVEQFHERVLAMVSRNPRTMNTRYTHDTKRSGDVRARLLVLSVIPQEFESFMRNGFERAEFLIDELGLNGDNKLKSGPAPNLREIHFILQTLLGTMESSFSPAARPVSADAPEPDTYIRRMQQYFRKAFNEAKEVVSWINQSEERCKRIDAFIAEVLRDKVSLELLRGMVRTIDDAGATSAITEGLLLRTLPGVPDLYQGDEIREFSLVDPDNRRPVDYRLLRLMLDGIVSSWELGDEARRLMLDEFRSNPASDRAKMFFVWRGLQIGKEFARILCTESYIPVTVREPRRNPVLGGHNLAFSRRAGREELLVVAPRYPLLDQRIRDVGNDPYKSAYVVLPAEYAGRRWRNLITDSFVETREMRGETVLPLSEVYGGMPFGAILVSLSQ